MLTGKYLKEVPKKSRLGLYGDYSPDIIMINVSTQLKDLEVAEKKHYRLLS